MTWLYIPNSPRSTCAPEPGASASASPSLSPGSAEIFAACAWWRGKPLPPQRWSARWKHSYWLRRLSGPTLPPSTRDRFAATFISSLPAIPANPTAWPESAAARTTIDSSSIRFSAWSRNAGLSVSSAKTCRGTPMDSSPPSSRHWKQWATALNAEYSARPKPAIRMDGEGSSFWHGVRIARGGYTRDHGDPSKERPTLEGLAENWEPWPTPTVAMRRINRSQSAGATERPTLDLAAEKWPTPASRDWKGINSVDHVITNGTGKMHLDQLPNFVEHIFLPRLCSSPVLPTADGESFSPSIPNSHPRSTKRRLNVYFVKALMRWPQGWTDCACSATAWILWRRHMLSFVSMLGTSNAHAQMQLL